MPFKPMLAKDPKYNAEGQPLVPFPLVVQPKLDGIRASVVNGKLVSRTLKAIPNAEIRAALERPEFEGLDGEIIVGDPTAEDCYRSSVSFAMSESKRGAQWSFMVFDKWDHDGPFWDRYHEAERIVGQHDWTDLPIFTVPSLTAADAGELERMEGVMVEAGHEGVIARAPGARYKFGRSTPGSGPLWKIKRFIDFEAEVIGVFEENHNANEAKTNALGRTERSSHKANKIGKGTLGGLVLRAINGPSAGIEFRCGTGFDAEQRASLWQLAIYPWSHATGSELTGLNGRTAKIKSFPIGVKDKPRHPVFLGWRDMEIDG